MGKRQKVPEPLPLADSVRAERDRTALARATKAVRRALEDTDHFDHGNMTSWEIADVIEKALQREFGA